VTTTSTAVPHSSQDSVPKRRTFLYRADSLILSKALVEDATIQEPLYGGASRGSESNRKTDARHVRARRRGALELHAAVGRASPRAASSPVRGT
jgi:hypothetical protein